MTVADRRGAARERRSSSGGRIFLVSSSCHSSGSRCACGCLQLLCTALDSRSIAATHRVVFSPNDESHGAVLVLRLFPSSFFPPPTSSSSRMWFPSADLGNQLAAILLGLCSCTRTCACAHVHMLMCVQSRDVAGHRLS